MFFWNSHAFSMILLILALWSLVPLLFLNRTWTSKIPSSRTVEAWLGEFCALHYFDRMWNECNCAVVWAFFGLVFLWDWNENLPFPVLDHCWVFQICWHIEFSTFTASSFRIWNSSTEIPSPHQLCLMLLKPHLTAHSRMSDSWWVTTPS